MDTPEDLIEYAKINSRIWQKIVLHEATRLALLGYSIVPVRKLSKSLPPTKFDVNYHSASKNRGTLKKWVEPGTGKFAGWNIGIACGKDPGVFVLDVDRHGDINGEESLKSFENQYGELPEGPLQRTPSGGFHHLFAWEPGAVSSAGKIAPGIDTRGGESDAFKSHIVVFPSVVVNDEGDAGQYEWLKRPYTPDCLPLAPNWAVTGNNRTDQFKPSRGNELVTADDIERLVPVDQIERMLAAINLDDLTYDDWLQIGQSINSQHCGDEGLDLWDTWSKRGQRYQTKECTNRWQGFDPQGKVRIGTLFYLAKISGWVPSEKDKYHSVPDEILYEINRLYPLVMISNKVRMVKLGADGSINVLHPNELITLYKNRLLEFEGGGRVILKNPVDLWLGWKHRLTFEGMGFYPAPIVCPKNHLNLWRGFAIEPEDGNVDIFTDFVREVICRGNNENTDWLLDWMAQIFQQPGVKLGTAVVLRGSEGTGKNTLTRAISKLLKPINYTQMVNPKHFMSNFNSYLLQSLVCVLNEAVWSGNHQEANLLKGVITEDFLSVELKGYEQFSTVNSTRLIIMTNETWAVPAGHQSRRYFVLHVSDGRKGDKEYWTELHDWINDHASQLLWYFLNREIKHDLRQALETSELMKQRELTALRDLTPADNVAQHLITKGYAEKAPGRSKLAGKWVWTNGFLKQVNANLHPYSSISQQFPRAIGRLFEEQGFTLISDRTRQTGRLFVLPETPEPLLECLSKKFSIAIPELEDVSEWTEHKPPYTGDM